MYSEDREAQIIKLGDDIIECVSALLPESTLDFLEVERILAEYSMRVFFAVAEANDAAYLLPNHLFEQVVALRGDHAARWAGEEIADEAIAKQRELRAKALATV